MGEKIRIRFFINTLGGGGAEKVLVELLKQLNPDRYDVALVVVSGGTHSTEIPKFVNYREITACPIPWLQAIYKKVVYKMPKRLFARLYMQGEFDIEIAFLEGFPTHVLAGMETTAKKAAFIHCDVSVTGIMNSIYPSVQKCVDEYSAFDRVCFVSNGAKRGFENVIGPLENAVVIHNVLDTKTILNRSTEETEFHYKTDGMRIISVGRLTRPKRYDRLIDIASLLQKKYNFEIWIVGEGEERVSLEKQIADLGVTTVRLLGFHNNPYSLLRQADLFVCSSDFEGYSTAVTEAVALGLPVLTTDCAGMDEILNNGEYGMIVKNNCDSLRKGLERILSDKAYYYLLKERANKGSSFQKMNGICEYEDLFANLLGMALYD